MPKAKDTKIKARVLVDITIDGKPCKCNDIVELGDDELAQYAGAVDPHPDAVAYAIAINNV